jgi:hypothetical protein
MSRNIDWTKPLSDEDRAWAEQFPLNRALIDANDADHRQGGAEALGGETLDSGEEAEEDEEVGEEVDYSEYTVAQLKAELESRNQPTSGTKAELVSRLEADDAAE